MIIENGKFWECDSHFSISHFHLLVSLIAAERDESRPYNYSYQRRNVMNHAPTTARMEEKIESQRNYFTCPRNTSLFATNGNVDGKYAKYERFL